MALEALAVRSTLAAIKTQLTTALPTAIDDVTTAGGLTPTDPTGYDATQEMRGELQPTRVKIFVEGTVDYEHYMTPQENLVLPLSIVAIMHESDDPETNDLRAHEMTRAIEIAMARTWRNITGAFWYRVTQSGVFGDPTPNSSRHRRLAVVRGTMKVRTNRVEA